LGEVPAILVTNYRDFVLVGQDPDGKPAKLESFPLAESEKAFWASAQHPRSLGEKVGARFEEYLLRVMRHAAQLAAPEDMAWFLASYARYARARIEGMQLRALATVRSALEEALGLKFEGVKGEHFFRSSFVQTLFYGVFSAWVLWAKQSPAGDRHLIIGVRFLPSLFTRRSVVATLTGGPPLSAKAGRRRATGQATVCTSLYALPTRFAASTHFSTTWGNASMISLPKKTSSTYPM
jgi:hypothetical protein